MKPPIRNHTKLPPEENISKIVLKWERRLTVFNATSAIVLLICLLYILLNLQAFKINTSNIPTKIYSYWLSSYLAIIFIRFRIIRLSIMTKRPNHLLNIRRLQLLFSVLMIGILIIPFIYISGITNGIAVWFVKFIPILGDKIAKIVASILSYVVSGIVGNLAYEKWKEINIVYNKRKNMRGKAR